MDYNTPYIKPYTIAVTDVELSDSWFFLPPKNETYYNLNPGIQFPYYD